jgi:hypothetical protein
VFLSVGYGFRSNLEVEHFVVEAIELASVTELDTVCVKQFEIVVDV